MHRTTRVWLVMSVLMVVIATATWAQGDLSGTWVYTKERPRQAGSYFSKSEKAARLAGRTLTLTVEQNADSLLVTETRGSAARSYRLVPNGQEQPVDRHPGSPAVVRWEDDALVIETPKLRETWSVSGDTLTVTQQSLVTPRTKSFVLSRRSGS